MIKYIIGIIAIAFVFTSTSCTHTKKITEPNQMMLGMVSKKDFKKAPYKIWFNKEYYSYTLDKANLDKIKNKLKDKEILIFFGSWCSDSRREVPRFIKILDYLDINYRNVHFTALDHDKTAPDYKKNTRDIVYVPTFIFLSNNKEIGRIIETPENTLELDMIRILK